jgi:hypothetical protein
MKISLKQLFVGVAPLAALSLAHADYPVGYPGGGFGIPLSSYQEVIVDGTSVTLTDEGGTGSWNDILGYVTPGDAPDGTNNNILGYSYGTPDATVTLSGLTAGSELILFLQDPAGTYLGGTWYTGSGTRNADGDVHADVTSGGGPGSYDVNFEDEPGSYADFNYGDGQILVTGDVSIVNSTPSPAALVPFGLGLVGVARRRFRK